MDKLKYLFTAHKADLKGKYCEQLIHWYLNALHVLMLYKYTITLKKKLLHLNTSLW